MSPRQDLDTFPNFFGTSAAAPHAAAVAALMLQAVPNSRPINIYKVLQETALDMGVLGVDNLTGYGFIQADQAIQRLRELEIPTISIKAIDGLASESNAAAADTAQIEITRVAGNINRDVLVNYTFGGTARNGTDYVESGSNNLPPNNLNGSILIPAGVSSVVLSITAVNDNISEQNETLDITLSNSSSYNLDPSAANQQATVIIADDDPLTRRLIVSGSFYGEDDESFGKNEILNSSINQLTIVPFGARETVILDKKIPWGKELRAEIYLTATIMDEEGNIEINGSVKLFEGTSENTNDLEDSETIKYPIPRRQIFSPGKIRLENVGFFGGTDLAEFELTFDNTLGNNDDGFSEYPS